MRVLRWMLGLLGVVALLAAGLLRWGGYLLIKSDRLPAHLEAAIVVQGSIESEMAHVDGAARLLQQRVAARMLLSLPKQAYWDEAVRPLAQN